MNKLTDMLSSGDGSISMMRVAVLLIILAILTNWVYLTIHTGQKQPLSWTEVTTMLGALGVKAAQVPFETKAPTAPVTPPKP